MGYDVYITRADFWASSKDHPISSEEWLQLVAGDPELELRPQGGMKYFAEWHGDEAGPDGAWFDWGRGHISTKWPSKAALGKMLSMAEKLNAKVQGDDGETYASLEDWEHRFRGA